ncbi:MAG TPA: HAMP domain-containing protein, partial [Ktedonobacterales bacterium]
MLKHSRSRFLGLSGLYSLRTKFALGYTLVALFAITAIFLAAIITVFISFGHFQYTQLSASADEAAIQLGQQYTSAGSDLRQAAFRTYPFARSRPNGALWLMDSNHQLILRPPEDGPDDSSQETSAIQDAMIRAMQGQEIQATLPGHNSFLWFDLSGRSLVAEPIHAGGTASGQVVGALALVELRPKPGTPPYTSTVLQVLLFTVLGTAVVVALLGLLLSRGVTRPLEQLTRAATQMAAGEYSQRVSVKTKDEVGRLAAAFNEMAS